MAARFSRLRVALGLLFGAALPSAAAAKAEKGEAAEVLLASLFVHGTHKTT